MCHFVSFCDISLLIVKLRRSFPSEATYEDASWVYDRPYVLVCQTGIDVVLLRVAVRCTLFVVRRHCTDEVAALHEGGRMDRLSSCCLRVDCHSLFTAPRHVPAVPCGQSRNGCSGDTGRRANGAIGRLADRYAGCGGHADSVVHLRAGAQGHTDSHADEKTYADAPADEHADSDTYSDAHRFADSHLYRDPNTRSATKPYADTAADADPYADSDTDANTYEYASAGEAVAHHP